MKKIIILLLIITLIFLLTSCGQKNYITPAVETTTCEDLVFSGSAEIIELNKVMFVLLKKIHGDHPNINSIDAVYNIQPKKVDGVQGFYVNNVGIKYSKSIVNKSQKLFGNNSSFSSRCQMTELDQLLCTSQLADLEKEFMRVLNGCTATNQPFSFVSPITKPIQNGFAWAPFFTEWGQNLLWLFLFLFLLFLLWHLLSWLWNNRPRTTERQTLTKQSSVEQKETSKQVSSNCCGAEKVVQNLLYSYRVEEMAGENGKAYLKTFGDDVEIYVDKKPTGFSRADLTIALAAAMPEYSGDTIISIVDSFNSTDITRLSNEEPFNIWVEKFQAKMK